MKLPRKIAAMLALTLTVGSMPINMAHANNSDLNGVKEDKLAGAGRWETAVEVSKKGWSTSDEAIIVNDSSLADALAATPFADAIDAPILLTGSNKLNDKTKAELKRLGVNKVYLIGGESMLSTDIESQLKTEKIETERIKGETREHTALEIAKKLSNTKNIKEIVVVNGYKGIADAVSVAAAAADNDMPIILSSSSNGTKVLDEFINAQGVQKSYVIGGENSISKEVEEKLPGAIRVAGNDRNETNAKVIEAFYTEDDLKNAYIAKDGYKNEDELIDALAVGVLAAKNDSPVILGSNNLNEMQVDVTNTKRIETVTQVGGHGSKNASNELTKLQSINTYNVNSLEQLDDVLNKSDAKDVININMSNIDEDFTINTDKSLTINLTGSYSDTVTIVAPNAKVYNKGSIYKIVIKDCSGWYLENTRGSKISYIEIYENAVDGTLVNYGTISNIKNDAEGTTIKNEGTITNKPTGTVPPIIAGNKPGGSGGGGGTTPPNPGPDPNPDPNPEPNPDPNPDPELELERAEMFNDTRIELEFNHKVEEEDLKLIDGDRGEGQDFFDNTTMEIVNEDTIVISKDEGEFNLEYDPKFIIRGERQRDIFIEEKNEEINNLKNEGKENLKFTTTTTNSKAYINGENIEVVHGSKEVKSVEAYTNEDHYGIDYITDRTFKLQAITTSPDQKEYLNGKSIKIKANVPAWKEDSAEWVNENQLVLSLSGGRKNDIYLENIINDVMPEGIEVDVIFTGRAHFIEPSKGIETYSTFDNGRNAKESTQEKLTVKVNQPENTGRVDVVLKSDDNSGNYMEFKSRVLINKDDTESEIAKKISDSLKFTIDRYEPEIVAKHNYSIEPHGSNIVITQLGNGKDVDLSLEITPDI